MIRVLAAAALAALLAGCATMPSGGSARSLGARMIAEGGAEGIMTNMSRGNVAIAHHAPSRTYCWSLLDPVTARIVIPEGAPAGDAVGCATQRAFTSERWSARRAATGEDAAAAVAARAAAEIAARPGLRPMPRPGAPGAEGLPSADDPNKPWLYGDRPRDPEAWLVSADGQTLIRVAARRSGGWLYEVRSEMTMGNYREWGGGNLLHIDDLFFPPDLEYTRRTAVAPPE